MASLKQLQSDKRVADAEVEGWRGSRFVRVELRQGWSIDPKADSRVFHEDTISAAMRSLRGLAMPFAGPYYEP